MLHRTALSVPHLVDFARATFQTERVAAYGSSMGGDIFLAALLHEHRLHAIVAERSTPDWARPGASAAALEARTATIEAPALRSAAPGAVLPHNRNCEVCNCDGEP